MFLFCYSEVGSVYSGVMQVLVMLLLMMNVLVVMNEELLEVRKVIVVVSFFGLVNCFIGMCMRCCCVCFGFFVNSFCSSGVFIGLGYRVFMCIFCWVNCILSLCDIVSMLFLDVVQLICEVVEFSRVMKDVVLMIELCLVGIMCCSVVWLYRYMFLRFMFCIWFQVGSFVVLIELLLVGEMFVLLKVMLICLNFVVMLLNRVFILVLLVMLIGWKVLFILVVVVLLVMGLMLVIMMNVFFVVNCFVVVKLILFVLLVMMVMWL